VKLICNISPLRAEILLICNISPLHAEILVGEKDGKVGEFMR
jgi:hypothetical protein